MLDLNIQKIDQEAANEGVWVSYDEGVKFKIASESRPSYKRALARVYKANKKAIDQGSMSEEKAQKMMAEIAAENLVLDWKGLKSGDADLSFDPETAKSIFTDPRYVELYNWVTEQASEIENFRSADQKK